MFSSRSSFVTAKPSPQNGEPLPARQANSHCASDDRAKHPVEQVTYNMIRDGGDSNYYWPKPPKDGTFLGKLRKKTGLDFDLPTEAQWGFACRAGNGSTKWGDGSDIEIGKTGEDENLNRLGCYRASSPAIVGSYEPNAWGIYDMSGNVWEWCLDGFKDDITSLEGATNAKTGSNVVLRGGCWSDTSAAYSRPARRESIDSARVTSTYGFRLVCTAGLQ